MKPPDDHAPNPGKHRLESDQIADACLIQKAPIVDNQDVAAVGARQGFKEHIDAPYVPGRPRPPGATHSGRDSAQACRAAPNGSSDAQACAGATEGWEPQFVRAAFCANFAEDRDIADPATLKGLLTELAVEPGPALERAVSPEVRAQLRANTGEAMQIGIFGASSYVVSGELFFEIGRAHV